MTKKLPVSAVVISFNEVQRLEDCLKSLYFCDEIIVCDLYSSDGSAEIGRSYATKFIQQPRVQFVEALWPILFPLASNDWILRFDPDQEIPSSLVPGIETAHRDFGNAGSISIPMLYYFLGRPIYCSVWGGVRNFPLLFNRRKITTQAIVHGGIGFDQQAQRIEINGYDQFAIKHYWVDSIYQMISKHLRYLRNEGHGRAARGEKFKFRQMCGEVTDSLSDNFGRKNCFKSGWRGYFLGFFHAAYVSGCHLSLLVHELKSKIYSAGK